jgi:bifunctional non-homologous end joining protein LigD
MSSQQDLVFVVQKHRAKTLHYDFRLEVGGVMPSWSIPKGPTLDSSVKRLAIPTEDHALAYRHFEGVLPDDQYGAGPVMIWDEGTYTPVTESRDGGWEDILERTAAEAAMRQGLQEGKVTFRLYGTKLHGLFTLLRLRRPGKQVTWLLLKHHDHDAVQGYDASAYDFSAVSHRSLAEIALQ